MGRVRDARPYSHAGRRRGALGRQPCVRKRAASASEGHRPGAGHGDRDGYHHSAGLLDGGRGCRAARTDPLTLRSHRRADDVLAHDHDGWVAVQSCELEPDRFRFAHAGRGIRRDVRRLPSLLQLRLHAGRAGVSPVGAEGDVQRRVSAGVLRHGARRHVPRTVLRSVAAHVVARNHEAACARRRVDGNRADRCLPLRSRSGSTEQAQTRWRFSPRSRFRSSSARSSS